VVVRARAVSNMVRWAAADVRDGPAGTIAGMSMWGGEARHDG
jgi:hypothetical protein